MKKTINTLIKEARNELYLHNDKHDWKKFFASFLDELEMSIKADKDNAKKKAKELAEAKELNDYVQKQLDAARSRCRYLQSIEDKDYSTNWEY